MDTERGPQYAPDTGVKHTVITHGDNGSTVITTVPTSDGCVSHSFMPVTKGILTQDALDASSPVANDQPDVIGVHRGLVVTQSSKGVVGLVHPREPIIVKPL